MNTTTKTRTKKAKFWQSVISVIVMTGFLSCSKDANQSSPNPVATPKTIDTDYTLKDNETWSGTVSLSAEVYVPQGKTLTIEAGTKVKIYSADAELTIHGSLLIKGTPSNVVRIYAPTISNKGYDWNGIDFYGEKLDASYCVISDALSGISLYRSTTNNPIIINHCLFARCPASIYDYANGTPVIVTNSTFLESGLFAYTIAGGNKKITIDACVFDNNLEAIRLESESSTDTRSTIVNVTKSNFLQEGIIGFIYARGTPANVSLTLSGCYGLKPSYPIDKSRGSSITITGSVSAPINGIGSGLTLDRTARIVPPSMTVQ